MNTMRMLWDQHVVWTRSFTISTAADLGDLDFVTKRLLRNPADFAEVLTPYYGRRIAARFEELLTEHLMIAANLVGDLKAGNTAAAAEENAKWYANADEIAAFLASINPCWTRREWTMMLHEHLKLTAEEATLRINGQYAADIMLFDSIQEQAAQMADTMALGIIKQFCI